MPLLQGRSAVGAALAIVAAVAAAPAGAHEVAGGHGTLAAGFAHPFTGIDHVLAIVTVGALAALRGGRASVAIPGAFLAAMIAGGLAALAGAPVPFAEQMILASLLVVGCLAGAGARIGTRATAAIVAAFAFFHGAAHGFEAPVGGGPAGYVLGFAAGAAVLLALGRAVAVFAPTLGLRPRMG